MAPRLADSQPHRILLIEDDDGDAGLVSWALKRQAEFPYSLHHVDSLEEYLRTSPPPLADVILLDLNLPGYDGLDAFRTITQSQPQAAIVVLTGLDDSEMAMAAVHSGAQDYLVKQNVNPHDICRAIRYAIERRATHALLLQLCDDFLAHVSHEIRTPLTAATAAVEMLEVGDVGPLPPEQHRMARIAHTNLRLLRAMVADLIDSAMVHSGTLCVRPRMVQLSQVILPGLEALTPLVEQARLSLVTDIDEDMMVMADPDRLTQVITNLLSNSIKFTPAGGQITVTSGSGASHGSADGAWLTVSDNGTGIPEHALPHLFNRLYQVPNADLRTSRGGLGLGLYLCRELMHAQQGDIHVDSAPDTGTRVTLSLHTAAPDDVTETD